MPRRAHERRRWAAEITWTLAEEEESAWPPAPQGQPEHSQPGAKPADSAATSCVGSVFLVVGALLSAVLAFGIMMGDPAPGTKVDRSPAAWLSLGAVCCLAGAVWLVVRAVALFFGRR